MQQNCKLCLNISLLVVGLISQTVMAANQPTTSNLSNVLTAQEPAQQFVTADADTPSNTIAAPTTTSGAPVLPPAPVSTPTPPTNTVIPAPSSTTPLGLNATEQPQESPFAGGLDVPTFLRCKQTTTAMCQRARSLSEFQDCFKRIKIPACKQFFAFANMTGIAPKDDIDLVKHYPDGGLDLIHLVRFGANYPGVYYSIGTNGDFIDLIFGAQTQKLDIRKNINYPEIAAKFPNTELFSIVDKLPEVQPNPDGAGLRLVFRFQLLNGCHACERAGYANVAYDFSDTGSLENTSIESLEPPK